MSRAFESRVKCASTALTLLGVNLCVAVGPTLDFGIAPRHGRIQSTQQIGIGSIESNAKACPQCEFTTSGLELVGIGPKVGEGVGEVLFSGDRPMGLHILVRPGQ